MLAVAEHSWTLAEREFQYVGGDVLRAGAMTLRADDLTRVRTLITTKSWWDTIDLLAAHVVGPMVARHGELRDAMDEWIDDADMWIARTAILHQLAYKESLDETRLFAYATRRAADTEFFIRKAIGWALRQHAWVAPDAVRDFVTAHHDQFSGLTRREAMKHLGGVVRTD